MAGKAEKKRTRRDPQQRAQAALDVATRKVEALQKRLDRSTSEVETLTAERDAAVRERDYLAQNPALTVPVEQPQAPDQPVA